MPLPLFPEHITIDVQVDGRCEGGSENEREKGGKREEVGEREGQSWADAGSWKATIFTA